MKGIEILTNLGVLNVFNNPCGEAYKGLSTKEIIKKVWFEVELSKPEMEGAKDCYDSGLFGFKIK